MGSVIFTIHDVILLMTAYQCFIFAILLLTIRREKWLTNVLLALFLLQYAAISLGILIRFGAEFRHIAMEFSPNLFYMFTFGYWLEAPLLLWYTRSLVYKNYSLRLRDLWYLLPFFAYVVYEYISYYSLDMEDKRRFQENMMMFKDAHFRNYLAIFRDTFRCALGILCLVELRRYSRFLQHKYSDIEKRELNWLRLLVIGFLIIRLWTLVVVCLVILAMVFKVSPIFWSIGLVGNYLTFLLVSLLIFYSLGNSRVVEGLEMHAGSLPEDEGKDKFRPEQVEALTIYMETEKPYLQPDLTLDKLAALVSMPPRTLSNIINRQFHCNFFEFISSYRIEEAKRLLSDNVSASRNILDIMYEVGFNSKTTFNTLFKKKVGITPSEYRKLAVG